MSDIIILTHDEAELILTCLRLYADEISYQINDSPIEHDPAGLVAWRVDETRCDEATGILAAKLYPITYQGDNDA